MDTQNPYVIDTRSWLNPFSGWGEKKSSGLFQRAREYMSNRKAEAAERESQIANNERRIADAQASSEEHKREAQRIQIKTEQERDARKRVKQWKKDGNHLIPEPVPHPQHNSNSFGGWGNQGHHARQIRGQRRRT